MYTDILLVVNTDTCVYIYIPIPYRGQFVKRQRASRLGTRGSGLGRAEDIDHNE